MTDESIQRMTRRDPSKPWHPSENPGLNLDHSPRNRTLFSGLTSEDWDQIRLDDDYGVALIQTLAVDAGEVYEDIVWSVHKRAQPLYDGDGPAFRQLLATPRCDCPDYLPLDEMQANAEAGRGPWHGCHGNPQLSGVRIYIDPRNWPSNVMNSMANIKKRLVKAWRDVGLHVEFVDRQSGSHITWMAVRSSNGWIGLAMVGRVGGCPVNYWAKYLISFMSRASLNQTVKLLAHEGNHNFGLMHISGDVVQNAYLTSTPWDYSFDGIASGTQLVRLYGGEPNPPYDEPPPPPPPDGETVTVPIEGRPDRIVLDFTDTPTDPDNPYA